jgi:hypothetical protein
MNSLQMPSMMLFPAPLPPPVEDPLARSVRLLGSQLRGEIAATEAYRHAVTAIAKGPLQQVLGECLQSHETRVALLGAHIVMLGGASANGSGLWGVFARTAEAVAAMLGRLAILRTLEEGERRGLVSYHRDIPWLDDASRRMVEHRLLPDQEETLTQIRRVISAAAPRG